MGTVGLVIVGVGVALFIWVAARPTRRQQDLTGTVGVVTEGRVVYLKEWMHEGHRRCQVEYTFQVANPQSGGHKTVRGKSNCSPVIFDQLELNAPLNIRYLPQSPDFSRPLFD